jgi:hypothetical protein
MAGMRVQDRSRRRFPSFVLAAAEAAVAAACVLLALTVPSDAQFWGGGGWGGWDRRPPRAIPQQQQQQNNPFGGGWWGNPQYEQRPREPQREAPADFSRAPAPQRKSADAAAASTTVLVLGDGMADWLAYGLEDAFSENPDISIVRKNRAASGLIRYDTRREIEWAQVAREAIAADKPKFIVMMVGVNDRQSIRERGPATAEPAVRRPSAVRTAPPPAAPPPPAAAPDPELQAQQSADQQNAEMQGAPEPPVPAAAPAANAGTSGTFEFHTEKWEAAYVKRIDATIAAMKSANVPVFWVGLPAQRSTRASSDSAYLNELYRGRAEKAGLSYVDVWDGFVDDQGRFTVQGPDFEGQTRRLRAGDGVYFTKAGARKLAHFVEREIQRSMATRAIPVALPVPEPTPVAPATPGARPPGGTSTRPLAGPVVPLTVTTGGGDELLGGGPVRGAPARPPVAADPVASRVLTKGEPITAPSGRADDFGWPRGSTVTAEPVSVSAPSAAAMVSAPVVPAPAAVPPATAAPRANAEAPAEETKPPVRRRPPAVRTDGNPAARNENNPPRPPQSINPWASAPRSGGWWR